MKSRKYRPVSSSYLAKSMVNLCVNMGTRVPDNVAAVDDIFNELFGADRFASRIIRCEDTKMILFMIDKYVGRNNLEKLIGSRSLMSAMRDLINLVSDIKYTKNRIKDRQKHGKDVEALKKELKFYNKAYRKTIIEFKSTLHLNSKGYKNKYKNLMNFVDGDKKSKYDLGLSDLFDDDLIEEDEEEYMHYNEFYRLPDVYTQEDLDNYNAYMEYQRMMGNAPDFTNDSFKMMKPGGKKRRSEHDDDYIPSGPSILDGLSEEQLAILRDDEDDDDIYDKSFYEEDHPNSRYRRDIPPQNNIYDPRMDRLIDMMSTLISLQTQNQTNTIPVQDTNIPLNKTPERSKSDDDDEISELRNEVVKLANGLKTVIEYLTEDDDDDEEDFDNGDAKARDMFNDLINSADDEEDDDEVEFNHEPIDIDPKIFHLPFDKFMERLYEYGVRKEMPAYMQFIAIYRDFWNKNPDLGSPETAENLSEEIPDNNSNVILNDEDEDIDSDYSEMNREELVNEFNNSEAASTKMVAPPSGAISL